MMPDGKSALKAYDALTKIFESYQEFISEIIEIEETFGEGSFKEAFDKFPEILEKVKEKNPEIAGKIGILMVDVVSISNKMNKLPELGIAEKKDLEKRIKRIVTQLKEIKKDLEKLSDLK